MSCRCDGETGSLTGEVLGMRYIPAGERVTGEKERQGTRSTAALTDTSEKVPGGVAGHQMNGSVLVH